MGIGLHGGMSYLNNFVIDLEYSKNVGLSESLNRAYFNQFPHLVKIMPVTDIHLQKSGVDKILILDGGKQIYVDEKIRRKDYKDILLEEYSDFDRKVNGWLSRKKYTDYISYIIPSSGIIYFLPFLLLQKVWVNHYKRLLSAYGRKFALNRGYRTSSIPVPPGVLFNLLKKEMEFGYETTAKEF